MSDDKKRRGKGRLGYAHDGGKPAQLVVGVMAPQCLAVLLEARCGGERRKFLHASKVCFLACRENTAHIAHVHGSKR